MGPIVWEEIPGATAARVTSSNASRVCHQVSLTQARDRATITGPSVIATAARVGFAIWRFFSTQMAGSSAPNGASVSHSQIEGPWIPIHAARFGATIPPRSRVRCELRLSRTKRSTP